MALQSDKMLYAHRRNTMIKPYSKNNIVDLWNDSYISKNMLKYHLQTDNDIASRNIKNIKDTVSFVIDKYKLNEKSALCDLGCGAGLYTNLFQQKGLQVTGVDVSTNSIEYAKEQNKNVKYINANYLELDLDNKFDFATMIYCDFGALTSDDRGVILDNVKSILKEDGLFMFDIWSYKFYEHIDIIDGGHTEEDGFYMKGKCELKIDNYKYDDLHLILTKIIAEGNKKMEFYNWDKYFNVNEITKLLNAHDMEIVDLYNNTYGEKYSEDSYCITVVCKEV